MLHRRGEYVARGEGNNAPQAVTNNSQVTSHDSRVKKIPQQVRDDVHDKYNVTDYASRHLCLFASHRAAFTLAEVLVTLGIIGIVAAMTIPTVLSRYNEAVTITKLKKSYNTLTRVYELSQLDNGDSTYWDVETSASVYITKYFLPYLKSAKICHDYLECNYSAFAPFKQVNGVSHGTSVAVDRVRLPVVLSDGSYMIFSIGAVTGVNNAVEYESTVYVDINGAKEPNKFGEDVFRFKMAGNNIVPYCPQDDETSDCTSDGVGFHCACLIIKNGWKIPDDYPIKF